MDLIAINAKLGDGHLGIPQGCVNARAYFNGKNVQWISFKRDVARKKKYKVSQITTSYSGYKDDWGLVKFTIRTDERLTKAAHAELHDVIENLSKLDLILWYLDDGSWHKTRKTMHLYCNRLNEFELNVLIQRVYNLYGIEPRKREDRKKDGRTYPYLYFPRALVVKFKRDVYRFLKWNGLDTLFYKVGETSTTIESTSNDGSE